MINPVLTKQDFVHRYQMGEFGNHSPTWDSLQKFIPYSGLVHLRNRVAGGETYYNLSYSQACIKWSSLPNQKDWYVSAMAPTELTLIQGEVCRQVGGLYLRYNDWVRRPMREALAQCQIHVVGLTAKLTLQHYLCSRSYDWLEYLLDTYQNHIIEFSAYGVDWGTVPGVNTVFWEVRKSRGFNEVPGFTHYY